MLLLSCYIHLRCANFFDREDQQKDDVQSFLLDFRKGSIIEKKKVLKQLKKHSASAELTNKERKGLKKVYNQELVKRSAVIKIAAAWVITVPASGIMAAILYNTWNNDLRYIYE